MRATSVQIELRDELLTILELIVLRKAPLTSEQAELLRDVAANYVSCMDPMLKDVSGLVLASVKPVSAPKTPLSSFSSFFTAMAAESLSSNEDLTRRTPSPSSVFYPKRSNDSLTSLISMVEDQPDTVAIKAKFLAVTRNIAGVSDREIDQLRKTALGLLENIDQDLSLLAYEVLVALTEFAPLNDREGGDFIDPLTFEVIRDKSIALSTGYIFDLEGAKIIYEIGKDPMTNLALDKRDTEALSVFIKLSQSAQPQH